MSRFAAALRPALVGLALLSVWLPASARAEKVFLNCSNQDNNAVSGGGVESTYALDNANRTRDLLVADGFSVIVDQDFNNSPSHANNWGADIFISIHSNAGGGHGSETLYKSNGGRTLASAVQAGMLSQFNFGDRGLKYRDDLHVLNATAMYACLPEVVFHDCVRDHGGTSESAYLRSGDGRSVIAHGLEAGVCDYFDQDCSDAPPLPAYAATYLRQEGPARMTSGDEAVLWVEYRNDGTATWSLDHTFLGTTAPRDRASAFFAPNNWVSPNRVTPPDHSNYGTGATGRFTFAVIAPEVNVSTRFVEHFGLVQEGVTWFGPADEAVAFEIEVIPRPVTPVDADGDGHATPATGGDDCNDGDGSVYPGAPDRCEDGVDSDCNGGDPACPPPPDSGTPPPPTDSGSPPPDLGGPADLGPDPDSGTPAPADLGVDAGTVADLGDAGGGGFLPGSRVQRLQGFGCSCGAASSVAGERTGGAAAPLLGLLLAGLIGLQRRVGGRGGSGNFSRPAAVPFDNRD